MSGTGDVPARYTINHNYVPPLDQGSGGKLGGSTGMVEVVSCGAGAGVVGGSEGVTAGSVGGRIGTSGS